MWCKLIFEVKVILKHSSPLKILLSPFLPFRFQVSLRLETHKEQNSSTEMFELWNRLVL